MSGDELPVAPLEIKPDPAREGDESYLKRIENLNKGLATRRENAKLRREGKLPPLEHKGGRKKTPAANKPGRAKTTRNAPTPSEDDQRRAAAKAIRKWRSEVGLVGLTVAPVPATYVLRTDDEVIDAMVRLAGKNAKALEMLARGEDVLAALVVLRWAGGLAVATGVQFGQLPPDHRMAQMSGVTEIVADLEVEGLVSVEGVGDADGFTDQAEPVPSVARVPQGVRVPVGTRGPSVDHGADEVREIVPSL